MIETEDRTEISFIQKPPAVVNTEQHRYLLQRVACSYNLPSCPFASASPNRYKNAIVPPPYICYLLKLILYTFITPPKLLYYVLISPL